MRRGAWWLAGFAVAGCMDVAPWRRAREAAEAQQHPGDPHVPLSTMPDASPRQAGAGWPDTVALVILDTVRADRTSACGHTRPTTPQLAALAADPQATLSCRAITPGTWTLPTHGTLFTGAAPEAHGLVRKGVTLDPSLPTLAEVWKARGHATVLVSANPVLHAATGLHRGFDHVVVADGLVSSLRRDGLVPAVRDAVAAVGEGRPLFLVVNVFDAHDPYLAIPDGLGWVPAQGPVHFPARQRAPDHPAWTYLRGALPEPQRSAWLRAVRDGYDHGVFLADRALGGLVAMLRARGGGLRLVVTSDHGENLGEHGLLRHDGPPWDTVAQVPLLVLDTTRDTPWALPEPVAVGSMHGLLRDGALPADPPPPTSWSMRYRDPDPAVPFADAAAVWPDATTKWLWRETVGPEVINLARDPDETAPAPAPDAPAQALDRMAATVRAARAASLTADIDPALAEVLGALGYVE